MENEATISSDILAGLAIFDGVDAANLHALTIGARLAIYQKGAVFLEQGQAVNNFFVILDGWCGASKGNADGNEAILQIFRRGDFLPEPNRLANKETSLLNLRTLTPVRLAVLKIAIVNETMERSAAFASNVLAATVQRSQELRDHIEQLTLHSAEERVGRFLLQMRFNTDRNGNDIELPFDKALIATYLGIKPETLSRTLQFFKESGFVIERNHLIVPDRQALCDYCDQATMRSCSLAHTDDCLNSAHGEAIS